MKIDFIAPFEKLYKKIKEEGAEYYEIEDKEKFYSSLEKIKDCIVNLPEFHYAEGIEYSQYGTLTKIIQEILSIIPPEKHQFLIDQKIEDLFARTKDLRNLAKKPLTKNMGLYILSNSVIKLFQKTIEQLVLTNRAYVPQQYLGINHYKNPEDRKFLVSTSGLQPCVGIVVYNRINTTGAIAHLDSDNFSDTIIVAGKKIENPAKDEQKSLLMQQMQQMLELMNYQDGGIEVSLIVTKANHDGLDRVLDEIFKNLLGESKFTVLNTDTEQTDFLLNMENGQVICMDYTEKDFDESEGSTIKEALGLVSGDFNLYHLKDGKLILQDLEQPFVRKNNLMEPKNCSQPKPEDTIDTTTITTSDSNPASASIDLPKTPRSGTKPT